MSRRAHARLRRTLCLSLRNARIASCFFNNMRNTNTKHSCKMQCGSMNFSATHKWPPAGFFANASARSIGKRALFFAPLLRLLDLFLALLLLMFACFNVVMLVHATAWLTERALAQPRNARRALEPARAARRLAASSSGRGASAARLPAALPRAIVYLPPAPRRTEPIAAELPWRPRLPRATVMASCH